MGQEAYAMFPMLAQASAQAAALRQATQQQGIIFGQQQQGQNIFGQTLPLAPQGGQVPGGASVPPEPGQASVPNIRVPQPAAAGGPAMGPSSISPVSPPADVAAAQAAASAPPPIILTPYGQASLAHAPPTVAPVGAPPAQGPGAGLWDEKRGANAQYSPPGAGQAPQGQPPAQGQPPQQGQPGSVSLNAFMAAAKKKFPNASGQALAQAANYYLPFMTEEDQARLRELLYTNNAAYHTVLGAAATERAASGQENATTHAADVGSKIDYRTQVLALKTQALADVNARATAARQQAAAIASTRADAATQTRVRLVQEGITKAQQAHANSIAQYSLADSNDLNQFAADRKQADDVFNATMDNLNSQMRQLGAPTLGKGNKQSMNTQGVPAQGTLAWQQARVKAGLPATPASTYGGINA